MMTSHQARRITDGEETTDSAVEAAFQVIREAAVRRHSNAWLSPNFWFSHGLYDTDQQDRLLDQLKGWGYGVVREEWNMYRVFW